MRYAKSISRLGELVEANIADYNTFKNLLLVCPHCSGSVYLVQTHSRSAGERQLADRIVKVNSSNIPAYFKHHGGEDLACELYDKSIGSTRIAQSISIARNQRADIFRSRFLDIFKTSSMNYLLRSMSAKEIDKKLKMVRRTGKISCEMPASLAVPKTVLDFSLERMMPAIDRCVEWSFQGLGRSLIKDRLAAFHKDISEKERVGTFETQAAYTMEAFDFMYAPSNRRLLSQVFLMTTIEIVCLNAVRESVSILNAPRFLDRNFNRKIAIEKVQEIVEDELIVNLYASIFVDGGSTYFQRGQDFSSVYDRGENVGFTLLLVATIGILLTIDWETEFQKYIKA